MPAMTCDQLVQKGLRLAYRCDKPATVFFMDGSASCNDHGRVYTTEKDFGTPKHHLGCFMAYDTEGRLIGLWPRLPMM